MENLLYRQAACPYCGELIEITLDGSAGGQEYIEDCSVCCRPIEVRLHTVDGEPGGELGSHMTVEVRRDDE